MTMNTIRNILLGGVAMATWFGVQIAFAQTTPWTREDGRRELERRDAVYERMARYGISREDVKSIGGGAHVNTGERATPYHTYDKILAERVLKPGEHYRFELDDYILTMVVPDAVPGQSWIVPYVDTRSEPERGEVMRKAKYGLEVANLLWHHGTGVWPLYIGWEGTMALTISYRYLKPEQKDDFSTPEKLRQLSSLIMKNTVPSQEEIDDAKRNRLFFSRAGNRVFLDAETVVINGRVWVRDAMNTSYNRRYAYKTALSSDRMLGIGISMPGYDYNANPDPSTYPAPLKRAFAQMDAMMASLRVAKRNDDGAPDPFVVERVEPAPLPVREKPTPPRQ
jgi:hypothetical protein